MKDINYKNVPKDAVFKDVVIIGNGPSGISLSYMLEGNWPYWSAEQIEKHPDEILRARLNYADNKKSLVEQNLEELSEGLEGRSTNPVSLLLDSLEHPCADLGMELPSMLEYKYESNRKIDHVVLGKDSPGGSWHRMDPKLRTLSLAAWMSLPGLSFADWEINYQNEKIFDDCAEEDSLLLNMMKKKTEICTKCTEIQSKSGVWSQKPKEFMVFDCYTGNTNNNESESGALCCKCTKNLMSSEPINSPPRRNLSLKRLFSHQKEVQTRALVSSVAQYYEDYVKIMNLSQNFMNDAIVTMVAPIHPEAGAKFAKSRWIVSGINKTTGRLFHFVCKNVVLANGVSDLANRLGLRSEQDNKYVWIKHELPELEKDLEQLTNEERIALKPVVIIGAGLSAADAVSICRSSDIPVIHIFRNRSAGLDKMLPKKVYPEYHQVQNMMKEPAGTNEYYTPLPEHSITDIITTNAGENKITVRHLISGETQTFEVSYCGILIGSRPDLKFISGISKHHTNYLTTTTHQFITSPTKSILKSICEKCKHLNLCNWKKPDLTATKLICVRNNLDKRVQCLADDTGLGLGVNPEKPIDSKNNQISVNKYTNEVLRSPSKGLFAMGPLVGDNFVRFIPGGALAITSALKSLYQEND